MPLNALWMHRLTPPWMGWMSPPAHLQLQVTMGIWSTAPSCQIFCWHQMWPSKNEARAECFPAINLVTVSRVLSIYCYLGGYQERRWWQTDCYPGAGPQGSFLRWGGGLEPRGKETKAWGRYFCCSQRWVGCGEKMEPDSSWRCRRTGQEARNTTAAGKFQLDVKNFFLQEASSTQNKWVTLVMRSLAGNAKNIANPNLPLNYSKTVWKQKQAYSVNLLGFYSGRKKSLLRMKGIFIPMVTHWSVLHSWNYSLARPNACSVGAGLD